jgi:23S rRNA U2552 (ribose-2'-O)-methylase RlmE/FtsJ
MKKHIDNKNTDINLILYQTPNYKSKIMDYPIKPSYSNYPNMPLFKYGFYYYIHQTKNKMELFEKPEFKTKDLHKIVNQFEDNVPQEEFIKQFKSDKIKSSDDMHSYSIKYFQSDKMISRAFYKLWELLMMFPLIKDDAKSITTLHIAEAPGSFVQSIIYYRNKFFKSDQIANDKYIATSIEPNKKSADYVALFNNDLFNYKQFSQWAYKDSDLTKPNIIKQFVQDHQKLKADLITADGGFNWKDENYQEQEAYILLLSEIYCALRTQKDGGSFVLKIFETFTELTVKMIEILKCFYSNVLITKPLLSRLSNSERYIICMNFTQNDTYAEKIFDIIQLSNEKSNKFLVDIFPDYDTNEDLNLIIKLSSTQISNEQHKQINNMISYINDGNYFGDTYRKYLLDRRNANDFWISTFYPIASSDLKNVKKLINILNDKTLNNVKITLDDLSSELDQKNININNQLSKSNIDSKSKPESKSESKSKPESKPESKTESKSKPDSKTESKSKPDSKTESKSKPESNTESDSDINSDSISETKPDTTIKKKVISKPKSVKKK